MSVTEITQSLGEWSLNLRNDTPQDILDSLQYFGHIAISASRVDPELTGDALLDDARYVGIMRDRSFGEGNKSIGGPGLAAWLGDEDDKGEVLEAPTIFVNSTFSAAINLLIPNAIQAGSITPLAGLYSGTHQFQSARKAINYICSLYDAEWRVRGKGFLDVGEISDLYVTQPKAAILRSRTGLEMDYKALPGKAKLNADVKDFTTRVVLIAEGTEATTVSATADINPVLNPYKDLFGNSVVRTRMVSEQQTNAINADARAQLQLNRFTSPRDALNLSTLTYDIRGDIQVGDYVWVYDPEAKLINLDNPITFYGEEIYPMKLRVFQLSWPVATGMGVTYRDNNGNWLDLTDWVEFESGETSVVVGGYNRSLTGVGAGIQEDPGSRPIVNSTIPGIPEWVLPFAQSTYQSDADGLTRAQVVLEWDQPLNTDSSVITDGSRYEIRRRTSSTSVYPYTHQDLSQFPHQSLLGTFGTPVPFVTGAWEYFTVSWDDLQFLMMDLTPGIPYDFQIRAIDSASPPNVGDWSDIEIVQTRPDTQSPSTPAACRSVAGSRNAIQIIHDLGKASGGTFNLESDLNHLQIHCAVEPTYVPDETTLLGKVNANVGMIRGEIPVIATFPLKDVPGQQRHIKVIAVDHFGNTSDPSAAVTQTAVLIDSAFISELTVSKVAAGIIGANWVQTAELVTATSGARVAIGWYGIEVFNQVNTKTLDVDSTTGFIDIIGKFSTGSGTNRIVVSDEGFPTIRFYSTPQELGRSAFINAYDDFDSQVSLGLNSAKSDDSENRAITYMRPDVITSVIVAAEGNSSSLPDQTFIGGFASVGKNRVDLEVKDAAGSIARDGGYVTIQRTLGEIGYDDGSIQNRFRASNTNCLITIDGDTRAEFGNNGHAVIWGPTTNSKLQLETGGNALLGAPNNNYIYCTGSGTQVVSNGSVKSFVIPHPTDPDRWLVHGCVEGPEAGVEYRGVAVLDKNDEAIVDLPEYFEAATIPGSWSIHLTAELADFEGMPMICTAVYTPIKNNKFKIVALGADRVSWLVKATRSDIAPFPVEPLREDVQVRGESPYTWLETQ